MKNYQFSVIIDFSPKDNDEILKVADSLGNHGCLDASICGHADGVEAIFSREALSLDAAIKSSITDIEAAGYEVKRVEMARESIT